MKLTKSGSNNFSDFTEFRIFNTEKSQIIYIPNSSPIRQGFSKFEFSFADMQIDIGLCSHSLDFSKKFLTELNHKVLGQNYDNKHAEEGLNIIINKNRTWMKPRRGRSHEDIKMTLQHLNIMLIELKLHEQSCNNVSCNKPIIKTKQKKQSFRYRTQMS